MAGATGLEPAASAVTGQRSNQLNYVPTRQIEDLWNATILRLRPIIEMSWAGLPDETSSQSQNYLNTADEFRAGEGSGTIVADVVVLFLL